MGNNFGTFLKNWILGFFDWISANSHAVGEAFANWWNLHVMTFYHAHASWINFCVILFIVLELLNVLIAYLFRRYIIRNSKIYSEIERINNDYPFYNLPAAFVFTEKRNRSDTFDSFDIKEYAQKEFRNPASLLTERFSLATLNRLQLDSYRKSIHGISEPSVSSTKGPFFRLLFEGLEKEIYRDAMVYPQINPLYMLVVQYTTKEKRATKKSWCDHVYMDRLYKITKRLPLNRAVADLDELLMKETFGKDYKLYYGNSRRTYRTNQAAQQTHSTAVPPGLRYQVLDRDNYQCVLCNRTSDDGVQLDAHFITQPPYGKAELSNLRTLCNECASSTSTVKKVHVNVNRKSSAPEWFVEQERRKMTSSLKESIKRRDGYRCKYCGRTEADGVSLEVDHIWPVSKWGRSEPDNLQTLCWDCNRGKSNSIPSNMKKEGYDEM